MLSDQLTDQQIEDGLALGRLTDAQRAAFVRLHERIELDIYRASANEKRSWLKGAQRVMAEYVAALAQTVDDARAAHGELQDHDTAIMGEASGRGGDLAIG